MKNSKNVKVCQFEKKKKKKPILAKFHQKNTLITGGFIV
jgi:hypothetical protein